MSKQINQYTKVRTAASVQNDDLLDLDSTEDNGTSHESAKMTFSELLIKINSQVSTIYRENGAITEERNVILSNNLNFIGGQLVLKMDDAITDRGLKIEDNSNNEFAFFGYSQLDTTGLLEVRNSSEVFFYVKNNIVSSKIGYSIDDEIFLTNRGSLQSVFVGNGSGSASLSGINNVTALGTESFQNIQFNGGAGVAVGYRAGKNITNAQLNFIFGNYQGSSTLGNENVVIGNSNANISLGGSNVLIGGGAVGNNMPASAENNVIIGSRAGFKNGSAAFSGCVAIGRFSNTDKNNQMVVGDIALGSHISEVVIGWGTEKNASNGTVVHRNTHVINLVDRKSNFNYKIEGSRGTGTGDGGDIVLTASPNGGVSGTTQNASIDVIVVKGNGNINFSNLPTVPTGLVSGDLWNNSGVINIV